MTRQFWNSIPCLAKMLTAMAIVLYASNGIFGQSPRCDPSKVLAVETCIRCHANEVAQWRLTPHFATFEKLAIDPRSKEITSKMGLNSVKRNDVCVACHFTVQQQESKARPIAGISCESCHGASRDWLNVHNDYGGPAITRISETPQHRIDRIHKSTELGMRNTSNVYQIARSCFECHTVPNEELVNIGTHQAGSEQFELVAWSQGIVRHNFLRSGGNTNQLATIEQLRVMYVAGLIADLEFSTRATAKATTKARYGLTVANRAANVATKLYELQQKIEDRNVQRALEAFAIAELRIDNAEQLSNIADQIQAAGMAFVAECDGSTLNLIDSQLPAPNLYRN